jgi:hypothetical protein
MLDSRRRRLGARTSLAVVTAAAALAVLLRQPFLHNGTYPDEGGMLVVARSWHTGGPFLYGDVFLARPPLLLLFFRAGDALGGILAVRVLGLVLVVMAVLAAAWAGSSLSGRRGAVTAAVVAAALLADPRLGTREIDAETVGLPLTLLACALLLAAMRRTTYRPVLVAAGGASAVGALLCKQNLADAAAFGIVLLVASGWVSGPRRRIVTDLGWLAAGAAVPLAATALWLAMSGHSADDFVYTLYGFRLNGGQTMLAHVTDSQGERLSVLVEAAVRSGLIPLIVASLWVLRRRLRDPVVLALVAMLVTSLIGVAGGGGYWVHYALGLVPVTALLSARAAGEGRLRPSWLLSVLVVATVVSSLLSTRDAYVSRTDPEDTWVGVTSSWLEPAQRPGDSLVVLYGEAALYDQTRLRPAYPYIWTLPMRVRDPELHGLEALLSGADAPTFVLVASPLDAWDIDPDGSVQATLDQHYRQVATVCGTPVYVVEGVDRPVPPSPTSCPD